MPIYIDEHARVDNIGRDIPGASQREAEEDEKDEEEEEILDYSASPCGVSAEEVADVVETGEERRRSPAVLLRSSGISTRKKMSGSVTCGPAFGGSRNTLHTRGNPIRSQPSTPEMRSGLHWCALVPAPLVECVCVCVCVSV